MLSSGVLRVVHVVPHGVPAQYCETPTPLRKNVAKSKQATLRLLYSGGLLWRKGIDLTLELFRRTFQAHDDVILVIHSVYGDNDVKKYVENINE